MATRLVAPSVDTLVILMGLRNLRKIMNRLLESGCEPQTSSSVDSLRYTTVAKRLLPTVQTIAELAEQAKFKSPTVIVVGKVVRLGPELHWFSETVIDDRSGIMKVLENSVEHRI
jgi:uroporphyrin-III C-methyltransferase